VVTLSHLKSLQALEIAVRLGSLKQAADVLAITPAAVGQRVKALEDYLGMDLLERGRSGLRPTLQLRIAMPHLSAAFRELDAVADALDLQRVHEIYIAAPSDFAELWLKPRLPGFRSAHPNIRFCINGEGDAPMRIGPVDCQVGFGPPLDEPSADLLFHDYVVPISSHENTNRIAALKRRERLEGFPLLHLDFYRNDPAAPSWSSWIKGRKLKRTAPERGIRFQRITAVLEAVFADAGLTLCGLALISDLVDAKRLSLPFPISAGAWTSHVFQSRFRSDALARPQVRRFRNWLVEEGEATSDWLSRTVGKAAA
jgi:LysR family transcriptional regulator, glycine cleavage system transcriptional activator